MDYQQWLSERENKMLSANAEDVTAEYIRKATPGAGTIRYDSTYDKARHAEEIEVAQWIHDNFGGDELLLNEINKDKKKTPDYLWNNKYWELKSVTTERAANSAIRKALKQISENPGGVILDYQDRKISYEKLEENIDRRMRQSTFSGSVDILALSDGRKIKVYRYNA